MTGASTLLLIITALGASGIQAYPSQCWSDNSVIDCKDDCLAYLDSVNNNADTPYTVDDLCCVYAETSASDTTVAHAGCVICNANGGNAYCAAGSSYNCFTECTTDECNDPGTLSGASGTCVASDGDDDDDDVAGVVGVIIGVVVGLLVCGCGCAALCFFAMKNRSAKTGGGPSIAEADDKGLELKSDTVETA